MRTYSEFAVDELVRLTLHGERDAYCELVRRYMNAVFRFTLNLTGNYHTAEDITQDTFIDGYTQLISLAEPSKYYAWLCGIARRKCLNRNAREHRFGDLGDYEEILCSDVPSPDDIAIRNETSARVRATVMTLSDKNRAAAELFYLDGLPAAAVAKRLRIPSGTVKRRLYDARQQLKKELYYMKDDYTLPADFEAEVKQKIIEIENYYRLYKCKDEKAVKLIKQAEEIAGKITDEKAKNNALASIYSMSVLHEEYITDKAIKNTESGENAKVICYNLINDALSIKDENEHLKFIDETALPKIRVMDYSNGVAELLYWKSASLVRLKRYDDAKFCINEAKRLMDPGNYYYPCLFSSLRLIEKIENNPERLKMSDCGNTAECLRYSDGKLNYMSQPGYNIGGGLRLYDIPSESVIFSAARCNNLFFDMNMKAGDTVTSAYDNSTLTFIGHVDGVKAGGKTFGDCLRYRLHATGNAFTFDADVYYAQNVGLVRIDYEKGDKKACAELSDYTINGGTGYMPLALGNKWSYVNTQLSSVYNQTIEYEVVYTDGENAGLAGIHCIYVDGNFENNPNADSDLIILRADEYYDEGKYDDTIRCLKLAVQRNTNVNAVATAVNAIQHFERLIEYKRKGYITRPSPVGGEEIEIKDGKAIYYNQGDYSLGCTLGLPRHEENKWYSVLPLSHLQILCGCLFDPMWKAGFTEDREYELYMKKLNAHIEVEDGGIVTVKAGTFENCLKVTVTSEKNGELEKNRRYYWWSYAHCGKKTFYFAPNVGVVRHECDWGNGDLVSVCDLSEYTSTATAGEYMPVYIGCSWVYDETTIEDAYILRKVYRVTHGMNRKFFLTTDQDFTYCGTESEYNAMRSKDK